MPKKHTKNPDWIIKNANELKRYSIKDEFKILHYTPKTQVQDNLLTSIFGKYHIENAGLALHKKGYYHSRINDSFTDLIIVRKGSFSAKFDRNNIKITTGNIIVIPPYKMCDNFAEKDGIEVYWIHPKISPFWEEVVPEQISFSTNGEFANVITLLDAYYAELQNPNCSKMILNAIAEASILSLKRNLKAMLPPVADEKDIIIDTAEEIAKKPFNNWTISSLAKKNNYSIPKINELFIEATSYSFSKYLAKCRMKASLKLIKSNKFSCEQIAMKAGFGNRRSFTKAFKRHFGFPPSSASKKI